MRHRAYIDGFNLYHGLPKKNGRRIHRWLNPNLVLKAACPGIETLDVIKYFTAKVKLSAIDKQQNNQSKISRQELYWRALLTLPNLEIVKGSFTSHKTQMPSACFPTELMDVIKTEEKGTDVNIAVHMLCDAFDNAFDGAILLSNDSDLALAVERVIQHFGKQVTVVTPPLQEGREPARKLSKAAGKTVICKLRYLEKSEFPEQLTDSNGTFSCPRRWSAHKTRALD